MKKIVFLFLVNCFLLIASFASAQQLPRAAAFGAQIIDLNDSTKNALKLSALQGTHIKKIVPGLSAQNAGLSVNDVLVLMDGEKIRNTTHFLELLKKHQGNDKIKIGFYRGGQLKEVSMVLFPKPMESSNDHEVIYSSVISGSNHLRAIITKPKGNGVYPAVLIVGGVGCYSIDNINNPDLLSIKMWVDSLTRHGFVTVRVEKPGMGDSKGTPCNDADFDTEKQGFLDGLKHLKSLAYVDKAKVFIAGFSMGGVIAPLIAQQEPVKGIIVYGTVGRNWLEYEIDNALRQQLLENRNADSIDLYMRADYIRLYSLFVEKKQPQQIIKEHPETAPNLFPYPMKTEYFQQVADVNIRAMWMKTKAKVLAMHGASDFVSSATEHKLIAETVNQYNPGNATYVEIAKSDHWSLLADTEKVSYLREAKGLNALPLITSIKWLKENS